MPVEALGMDVACEDSAHQVTPLAPNMCITPAAPSPLPMPYPLMGNSAQLDPGTEKTKINGKKVLTSDGAIKQVHGNEPGTQKDIITFQTTGHAFTLPIPAVVVQFEGGIIAVTGNPGFANTM